MLLVVHKREKFLQEAGGLCVAGSPVDFTELLFVLEVGPRIHTVAILIVCDPAVEVRIVIKGLPCPEMNLRFRGGTRVDGVRELEDCLVPLLVLQRLEPAEVAERPWLSGELTRPAGAHKETKRDDDAQG